MAQTAPTITNWVNAKTNPIKPHGVYYLSTPGSGQWVAETSTPAALAVATGGGSQAANAFSFGMWINDALVLPSAAATPVMYMAQGRGQSSNLTFQLHRQSSNQLRFQTSHDGATVVNYTSTLTILPNQWMYIAVSFNPAGNVVIYLWDGTNFTNATVAATDANIFTPTMPIGIGCAVGVVTSGVPSTIAGQGRAIRFADAFFVNGYAASSTDIQNARDNGAYATFGPAGLGKQANGAFWLLDKQIGPLVGQVTPTSQNAYNTFADQGPVGDSLYCANNAVVDYTLSTLPAVHAAGGFHGVANKMPFGILVINSGTLTAFNALSPSILPADAILYRETGVATGQSPSTATGAAANCISVMAWANYSTAGATHSPSAQSDIANYPASGDLGTTGPYTIIGLDIEGTSGTFSSVNDQPSSGAAATHGIDRTDANNCMQIVGTWAHSNGFKMMALSTIAYTQSYGAIWAGFKDANNNPSIDIFLLQAQNQLLDTNTFLNGLIPTMESILAVNPNAIFWIQFSVVAVPAGDINGCMSMASLLLGYPSFQLFEWNWSSPTNWGMTQIYAALYGGSRP